ncbi:hypothetical protein C8R44DRAFT_742609 [Mycena epipterygia]|nr:hypothetical protein C8R44DRAFT_742609 [Mycena epipterygia]
MPDYVPPPLNENFWNVLKIDDERLKSQTGIHNSEVLKKHIVAVQAKVYEVEGYHCICSFVFTRAKISHMAAYLLAILLGHERPATAWIKSWYPIGCLLLCSGTKNNRQPKKWFELNLVPLQNNRQPIGYQGLLFWAEQQLRAQFLSVFLFSISSDFLLSSRIKFMTQVNTFWDISQQDSSSISV